jgi:hypothetical protein
MIVRIADAFPARPPALAALRGLAVVRYALGRGILPAFSAFCGVFTTLVLALTVAWLTRCIIFWRT